MANPLPDASLDQLFRTARTKYSWLDKPVSQTLLRAVYDLAKMGPTSANCSPARFTFITSKDGKERLRPHLSSGNVDKTMSAPATVIIAHDLEFYAKLPKLFPQNPDARNWFTGDEEKVTETAFRNGTLQGAYLMLAARSLGLDCGPMSGFDNAGVDREFFAGTSLRSNWLCNLGYGGPDKYDRLPRLGFDEACEII